MILSQFLASVLVHLFSIASDSLAHPANSSDGLQEIPLVPKAKRSSTRNILPPKPSSMYNMHRGMNLICYSDNDKDCLSAEREEMRRNDPEYRLYTFLFSKYNKEIRPVLNKSEPVKVKLDFAYSQLVDMSERQQQLTSAIWFRQYWTDPWLSWNESEFGGIKYITVDPRFLWLPDIMLYNNVDKDTNGEMYKFASKAKITSDGSIHWPSPVVIKSECKIDIKYFPFDDQKCVLIFGSWIYDGHALDLKIKSTNADMSIYTENGEWSLISVHGRTVLHYYECCNTPYYYVEYTVHIRRRILFYLSNLILPCLLLVILSAFAFKFPTPCGERASLQITILLGMTVYMLIFTESIPPTSEATPLIGIYFLGLIGLMTLAILATCLSLRLYHNEAKTDLPTWVRILFIRFLATLFRMTTPREEKSPIVPPSKPNKTVIVAEINNTERPSAPNHEIKTINSIEKEPVNKPSTPLLHQDRKVPATPPNNHTHISFWDDFSIEEKGEHPPFDRSSEFSEETLRAKEWRFVSIVVDKLFFWMFLLFIFVFTTGIAFMIPSHFTEFI